MFYFEIDRLFTWKNIHLKFHGSVNKFFCEFRCYECFDLKNICTYIKKLWRISWMRSCGVLNKSINVRFGVVFSSQSQAVFLLSKSAANDWPLFVVFRPSSPIFAWSLMRHSSKLNAVRLIRVAQLIYLREKVKRNGADRMSYNKRIKGLKITVQFGQFFYWKPTNAVTREVT